MNAATWQNWAGTVTSLPRRVTTPRGVDEIAALVAAAHRDGRRVKAVGAGHSFSPIAATDDILVRLDHLTGVPQADVDTGLVTVLAGTPLHALSALLAQAGLAMSNLGDIDRQTVAGALSTGTHGTGAKHPGLAGQVEALQFVSADGAVQACSATTDPDLFAAARVGLGALGIITAVTLRCVPAFVLVADERPMPLGEVLADLDDLVDAHDHFEFYWFPHTMRTLTKHHDRAPAGAARPLSRFRSWLDDEFLANLVFEWTNRVTTSVPRLTPAVNSVAARALSARTYADASHRVFVSPRRVVFRESEWAVPRAAIPAMLADIGSWIDRSGERISFPIEVRFAAEDDIWLSTAHGRETGHVAVHQYHRLSYDRYFRAVSEIAARYEGRPHWGKIHWLGASALHELYPRFDDFRRLRDRLDPGGVFTNPYLDTILGPPGAPS
ncbi:D-arabinono-1,4-lactone oxidase [Actinopolymorpha sp. B11F2]|uniref:D-arabinono-1,4-lactone oxidase n=1 Tax=Actinopolymorpha sp. B11F2 TaxID=3160862 RepID=UPI0032E37F0E